MSGITQSKHWSDLASDPMDPFLLRMRRSEIDRARRPPVARRVEYLCALVAGKKVLDVGIVDHLLESDRAENWLHGQLASVAETILGVDVLADAVQKLAERGYNVACLDLTNDDLPDEDFDVIIAGELIEHLGRPGELFSAAARLLRPGGRLVLTTPNPFAIWRCYQHLLGRPNENVDHVAFFSPGEIIELAARAGMRLDSFRGAQTPMPGAKASFVQWAARHRLLPFTSESACESLLYEVIRD